MIRAPNQARPAIRAACSSSWYTAGFQVSPSTARKQKAFAGFATAVMAENEGAVRVVGAGDVGIKMDVRMFTKKSSSEGNN